MLEKAESLYLDNRRSEPAIRDKKLTEAIGICRKIHETYPESREAVQALIMIGISYDWMEKPQKALEAFEYAVVQYGDRAGADTYYYLGSARLRAGEEDGAVKAFQKCIELCRGVRDPNAFPYKDARENLNNLRQEVPDADVSRIGMRSQLSEDEHARLRASCANNLKQMGLVFKMFANEHNGMWPSVSTRKGDLMVKGYEVFPEYLTDLNVLRCPGNVEHKTAKRGDSVPDLLRQITDRSYFYLGWVVTNEEEGLALLDAYEAGDPVNRDKDIAVPHGAGQNVFYRIREGIERFLITDIQNPAASALAQSEVPVMWERPGHHVPDGGNVLYMDGHVEFVKYPGRFPMTAKFMARLAAISEKKEPGDTAQSREACRNNLKQMGLVFKMYANEWNGRFPPIDDERGNLTVNGSRIFPEYLSDLNVLRCPANKEHEPWRVSSDWQKQVRDVTDKSYFYLSWVAANEEEGLALLDAYESLDMDDLDKDVQVASGKGTAGGTTIFRLREGIERFLITDINDPRGSARAQSTIPIMWERPGHHPDGSHVLYMDGHVEFVEFPGRFPMNPEFMDRLIAVSANKDAK
jgi:prepilin-type processing-associated H-X9-DG protein